MLGLKGVETEMFSVPDDFVSSLRLADRPNSTSLSFLQNFEHSAQEPEIVPAHFPSGGGRGGPVGYDVNSTTGWEFHRRNATA